MFSLGFLKKIPSLSYCTIFLIVVHKKDKKVYLFTINGHFYPHLSGCFCSFLKIFSRKIFTPQVVAVENAKNLTFLKNFFKKYLFPSIGRQRKRRKYPISVKINHFFSLLLMDISCCRVVYFLIKTCFENKKKRVDKTHLK